MANNNPIPYTNLDFSSMKQALKDIVQSKKGLTADVSDSSYTGTQIEMFAATTDALAYWLNQGANDALGNSQAMTTPAIYANAKSMGYSIRRPTPCMASFGARLKRTGKYSEVHVLVKKGTALNLAGRSVLTANDVKFSITFSKAVASNGYMTVIKSDDGYGYNTVIEGIMASKSFISTGQLFQKFVVNDPTFSDWYGDHDPMYDEYSEYINRNHQFTSLFSDTPVGYDGPTQPRSWGSKIYWKINRYGYNDRFIAPNNPLKRFEDSISSTQNYTVWVNTNNAGQVVLEFADNNLAAIPSGSITISYLSTSGAGGVMSNVAGTSMSVIDYSGIVITNEFGEISDILPTDIDFIATSDLIGGLDIESNDSIKANTPSAFRTAGIISNDISHVMYLTNTVGLKFAMAYGEDEINRVLGGKIRSKYEDMIRFTGTYDLYIKSDSGYSLASDSQYTIKGLKVPGLMNIWDFDNLQDSADFTFRKTYLPQEYFTRSGSQLDVIKSSLKKRGIFGAEYVYVPPFVHKFDVNIIGIIDGGANVSKLKSDIINAIYGWCRDNTNFSTAIGTSQITDELSSMDQLVRSHVSFTPIDVSNGSSLKLSNYNINDLTFGSSVVASFISSSYDPSAKITLTITTSSSTPITISNITPISIAPAISAYLRFKASGLTSNLSSSFPIITISDLDELSSYIWYSAFGNLLDAVNVATQSSLNATIPDLSESIRRWDFDSYASSLTFDVYGSVVRISDVGNYMYGYITYVIEYIKLVRDFCRYEVGKSIIDENGDITNFSTKHEIVQLRVLVDNITIKVAK